MHNLTRFATSAVIALLLTASAIAAAGPAHAANAPPVVTLVRPLPNDMFHFGEAVLLAANATDLGGAVSRVEFRVGGLLVGTDTTAPYFVSVPGIALGDHVARATAYDNGTPALSAEAPPVPFTVRL